MDRQMVYVGSIPLDTDLLNIQRNVLVSLGALAKVVLGRDVVVDGLPCSPNAAAYCVTVGPGSCTVPHVVDAQPFGSLPASALETMRTALLPADVAVQLGGPPDGSHVVCWLIQAAVSEVDAGPVVLPYWNAANPSVPFGGPGNSGQPQATQRLLRVVVTAKSSGPQTDGGVPPAADAGAVGLYQVTTHFNKPGIEAADIVPLADAPVLRFKLPVLPPGFTRMDLFDASSTWRVPAGVRHVRIRLVGGGGGGGGGGSDFSGGGGGAGGYAESLLPVVPGALYTVTAGAGGGGGTSGQSGSAGTGSAFGTVVVATGGAGGGSANPDSHGGGPGLGTAGAMLMYGGFGGDGANIAQVPAGNGGTGAFGGGGRGSNQGGLPAYGQAKGSGGGGGYGAGAGGGGGGGGCVIIEY